MKHILAFLLLALAGCSSGPQVIEGFHVLKINECKSGGYREPPICDIELADKNGNFLYGQTTETVRLGEEMRKFCWKDGDYNFCDEKFYSGEGDD